MKFEDVLGSLREGNLCRRSSWAPGNYIEITIIIPSFKLVKHSEVAKYTISENHSLSTKDILATDWEILTQTK